MTERFPAPAGSGARPARVLLVSIRRINKHAAWCSNYEFEDVIRSVDDVDLLELEPASHLALRQRAARSLAARGLWSGANPGIREVELTRDYDLLVFVAMNPWDVLSLNAVRDWRKRCKVAVCYMVEFYAGLARALEPLLRLLHEFDHVTQAFSGSVQAVGQMVGRPCHHVALAADALRFAPFPEPPPRVIDVLSIGRRAEGVHQSLLRLAAGRRVFYLHDTIPGPHVLPASPVEHREMYANSARRSRLFVTYPAKFGDGETQGQSEVGARYYEGAAAGAVLLGQAPEAASFRAEFPWPDAVVEARPDGSDAAEVVGGLLARPDELRRMGTRNAAAALRRHDWSHRWRSLLELARLPPRPALAERLQTLDGLAAQAERGGTP